ncbi:MAG TPA: OB-fold nucleic acid binding domain-containing protein [Actinomycetota bacterium]|nr:OB-fold nucleic acid binding domain-containing protein [Actinomycetota bacterium]
MGLLDGVRRFLHRMAESDEQRLQDEIQAWASAIPGTSPIAEAPTRTPVKIAGVVRRITVHPEHGLEALEALLADGTGEMSVLWMGRRSIPGLTLGTRVVVEGVVGEQRQGRRMVNPSFEFSA